MALAGSRRSPPVEWRMGNVAEGAGVFFYWRRKSDAEWFWPSDP